MVFERIKFNKDIDSPMCFGVRFFPSELICTRSCSTDKTSLWKFSLSVLKNSLSIEISSLFYWMSSVNAGN